MTDANDIVTVTDFLSGTDQLAMTTMSGVGLTKIQGIGDNAQQALDAANVIYDNSLGREYIFVYGGTGAGYLFYNGDIGPNDSSLATAGMALSGQNGENSVMASDITLIPTAIHNMGV
jgi:hypothetical protein